MDNTSIIMLAAIGVSAGVASGLFGIGGGILIVPALVYLLGFSQHQATGTSLAILLPPVGLGAVFEYAQNGNVNWKAAVIVALTLLIGAWLGSLIGNKLSGPALRMFFGVFVVFVGVYSVYSAYNKILEEKKKLNETARLFNGS